MKRKLNEKYVYYGIMLFVVAIFLVIMFSERKKRETELDIESKLPKIQQEETQSKAQTEEQMIRVVIKTNGFQEIAHAEIKFQAEGGLIATAGNEKREYGQGEVFAVTPDDAMFQKGTIKVESVVSGDKITVSSLNRGYGTPSYLGSFELFSSAEGMILVNELPLEEYLYAVVPSEMPASYELEALKAQAVCARSYAYNQTQGLSYPEYNAHVDDSTSFQVYGNSKEQESAVRAVDETRGQKLWYQNQVVTAYYYSTSCGKTTGIEAWGTTPDEQNQYLQSVEICKEDGNSYEAELPWYRWKAVVPERVLSNLIELNTATEIGTLQNVSVTKRGAGGVALQIVAQGDGGSVTVDTENKIRRALGGKGYQIEKQDGTVVDSQNLLPSAFFQIEKSEGNYIINGGGYGHGIGMSQNGANEMAKCGKTYIEILQLFYQGVTVE